MFLSRLLLLFQFCHLCFFPKPKAVAVTQTGTMLTIESECSNCGEMHTWKSQPDLLGRFPAGNLLLSFAVLCAGASIRKVLLVFQHMGMLVYHEPTYYYHQRHVLIPSVVGFWRKYQKKLLNYICWLGWRCQRENPFLRGYFLELQNPVFIITNVLKPWIDFFIFSG